LYITQGVTAFKGIEVTTKKGLNQLIEMITNSEVEKIVILYKDRLLRFGFEKRSIRAGSHRKKLQK